MHASPPVMTLIVGENQVATSPASTSPSLGPPVTTKEKMPHSRPRSRSGTMTCRIVDRKIALTTSAAPAIARKNRASGRFDPTRPNAAIAAPHPATAQITASPWRRMRVTLPDNRTCARAPTAGAAKSSPTTASPRSNWLTASTGKSAAGMPKIIATRSITNVDWIRRWCTT